MGYQIRFFRKNAADIDASGVTVTASQGDDVADLALNRTTLSGWMTTGSVDADNTTFQIDWDSEQLIDSILLVHHNFKNYTLQYWNGSAWTDFSTTVAVTNNTDGTTFHEFTEVSTTKLLLTVTGTQTANEDKYLGMFIATTALGQFAGWPQIKKPLVSRNRQVTQMLSGKRSIHEGVGNFACTLSVQLTTDTADLALVETLYDENEGFHVWLCGGSESQFSAPRKPYRLRDVFLMKCADELEPELHKGIYVAGMKIDMQLTEVVD